MKAPVMMVKRTGVTFAELIVSIVTLIMLNAVVIVPLARVFGGIFNRGW